MHYQPPPPEELRRLRDERQLTNAQLAEMFGVSTGGQFHKYLSDKDRRAMGFHVLMHGMLNLALMSGPVTDVEQLYALARSFGAVIEPDAAGEPQQ